jgi:transposase-like protein
MPGRRAGHRLGHLQVRGLAYLRRTDEVVTAFRTRRLDYAEFPYVYVDATYLHVRNNTPQAVSMAVVVATGITADGGREVLGLDVGDSEDEVFWRRSLSVLERRGLTLSHAEYATRKAVVR